MSAMISEGTYKPARLVCQDFSNGELQTVFEALPSSMHAGVIISIGTMKAIITREELAAAATLFPADRTVTIHNR